MPSPRVSISAPVRLGEPGGKRKARSGWWVVPGGPRSSYSLPHPWMACLLIHPTQCHMPGDTRGLGLPKDESRTSDWAVTCVGGNSHVDKGGWVVWRSFACRGQDGRSKRLATRHFAQVGCEPTSPHQELNNVKFTGGTRK
jgi:hypothetical protein